MQERTIDQSTNLKKKKAKKKTRDGGRGETGTEIFGREDNEDFVVTRACLRGQRIKVPGTAIKPV